LLASSLSHLCASQYSSASISVRTQVVFSDAGIRNGGGLGTAADRG